MYLYLYIHLRSETVSHVTFTELRTSMAKHFDRVEQDRTELVVTRQNHEPVVLMPLAELVGLRETNSSAEYTSQCRTAAAVGRATRCGGRCRSGVLSRSEAGFLISGVGRLPILAGNRSSSVPADQRLIKDACRSPFNGIGKPEPLAGNLRGWWSRRITREHRLVYRVTGTVPDQALEIAMCRFHYGA